MLETTKSLPNTPGVLGRQFTLSEDVSRRNRSVSAYNDTGQGLSLGRKDFSALDDYLNAKGKEKTQPRRSARNWKAKEDLREIREIKPQLEEIKTVQSENDRVFTRLSSSIDNHEEFLMTPERANKLSEVAKSGRDLSLPLGEFSKLLL